MIVESIVRVIVAISPSIVLHSPLIIAIEAEAIRLLISPHSLLSTSMFPLIHTHVMVEIELLLHSRIFINFPTRSPVQWRSTYSDEPTALRVRGKVIGGRTM